MPKISAVTARQSLDAHGTPSVMCDIVAGDQHGTAMLSLAAFDDTSAAATLVQTITTAIHAALLGKDTANQSKVDRLLLELAQSTAISPVALLVTSLAVCRTEAISQGLPLYLYLKQLFPKRPAVLPIPHVAIPVTAPPAASDQLVREFRLMLSGAAHLNDAVEMGKNVATAVADLHQSPGKNADAETVFTILTRAMEVAHLVPGVDAFIGVDVAAQRLYEAETATYRCDGGVLATHDLTTRYSTWRQRYPVLSLQDPFAADSWEQWQAFTHQYGHLMQVIGDELYRGAADRVQQGIVLGATRAVAVRLSYQRTLSQILQTILLAQEGRQHVMMAANAVETEDTFVVDLAVAVGADHICLGPIAGDRIVHYNRLLAIESESQLPVARTLQPWIESVKPQYQAVGQGV